MKNLLAGLINQTPTTIFWLLLILFSVLSFPLFAQPITMEDTNRCFTEEWWIVRGHSLEPLIKPGEKVKILKGYYDCHPVERGDIVVYHYMGNRNPIIKIIKAIPGDKLSLRRKENGSGWQLFINDKVVKNSEKIPYTINYRGYKMLSLYIKDYKGVIPPNTYLILGNRSSGSLDSRVFGLIDKSDIIGKVER